MNLSTAVRTFVDDEEGITAIEYGLIAAVMAAAISVAFGVLSGAIGTAFNTIKDMMVPPASP